MENRLLYNPTLQSVLMVEETIEKHSGEYGKYQIWKSLPRKVMYQTFQVILDYLVKSKKIVIDKDGCIIWIWDPKGIEKLRNKNLIIK